MIDALHTAACMRTDAVVVIVIIIIFFRLPGRVGRGIKERENKKIYIY